MRIGILGTRGIPNLYGGFEQHAQYLSKGLVENGYEVFVYNSHNHPFQNNEWNGVKIIHCYDPEDKLGTTGQFVYDFNCIIDARKRNFDIILQLGYTSSSLWGFLLPKRQSKIFTNMDGLEWKRTKYSSNVKKFLQYAENWGVKTGGHLISDSIGIQNYLKQKYNVNSTYIPYGTDSIETYNKLTLNKYNLKEHKYNLLIARLEPENSVEIILDGFVKSENTNPFLVIGKHDTKYGEFLKNKFLSNKNIYFLGGIYEINILNDLRFFSNLYFHGHTVGGTNPSLLEAMGSKSLICAHDNIFNKSILGHDAFYFENSNNVANLIKTTEKINYFNFLDNNFNKVKNDFNWKKIIDMHITLFKAALHN